MKKIFYAIEYNANDTETHAKMTRTSPLIVSIDINTGETHLIKSKYGDTGKVYSGSDIQQLVKRVMKNLQHYLNNFVSEL